MVRFSAEWVDKIADGDFFNLFSSDGISCKYELSFAGKDSRYFLSAKLRSAVVVLCIISKMSFRKASYYCYEFESNCQMFI